METRCEQCGRECWIDDEHTGEQVLCPWCDRPFSAKESPERLQPLAAMVESLLAEIPPIGSSGQSKGEPAPAIPNKKRRRHARRRVPKLVRRLLLASLAVSVAAGMFFGGRKLIESLSIRGQSSQQAGDMPRVEWRADPALLALLGEPRGVDHFSFRPPTDFKALMVLPDPGWLPKRGRFTGLMWRGALGDKAELYCTVVEFPEGEPPAGGLEEALERFFEWLGHHAAFTRFSHGQGETGLMNGRNCIRTSFSGRYRMRSPSRVEPREGVVYVMLDQQRQISLYTLCSPEQRETHDLMGASLLTWKEN